MSQLVNLEWNVFTRHDAEEVNSTIARLCRQHRPHVVTVLEAAHQRLGLPGYHLLQEEPRPMGQGHLLHEEGETALLIRNDVKIMRDRVSPMTESWTGPKNDWPHDPRRYRSAWIRLPDGVIWKYQGAHWPTGGPNGRNGAAVRETMEFADRWLTRTIPNRPTVLSGDLNLTRDQLRPFTAGGSVREIGSGPDHALYKNCSGHMQQLDEFGSDHHAYVFTFKH